jgi:hypothetical protein
MERKMRHIREELFELKYDDEIFEYDHVVGVKHCTERVAEHVLHDTIGMLEGHGYLNVEATSLGKFTKLGDEYHKLSSLDGLI